MRTSLRGSTRCSFPAPTDLCIAAFRSGPLWEQRGNVNVTPVSLLYSTYLYMHALPQYTCSYIQCRLAKAKSHTSQRHFIVELCACHCNMGTHPPPPPPPPIGICTGFDTANWVVVLSFDYTVHLPLYLISTCPIHSDFRLGFCVSSDRLQCKPNLIRDRILSQSESLSGALR